MAEEPAATPDEPDTAAAEAAAGPAVADPPASGSERLIDARGLTKSYGHTRAASDVSFELRRGEILGFLGPNGAGKSTTLKMITGTLVPDRGTAKVDGIDITEQPLEARRRFGYLPESLPLYWEMQVEEYLKFVGQARGVPKNQLRDRIDHVVSRLGLERMMRRATGALSKGYRQRVGLAQAMLHDPPVLILDEPTNGLDPKQIVDIRALLTELAKDRAILFSTHILQEIAAICSRIMVIHQGRKIADDRPEALADENSRSGWEIVIDGGDALSEKARGELGVSAPLANGAERIYSGAKETPSSEAADRLAREAGGALIAVRRARATLEQAYLRLTGVLPAEAEGSAS